MAPMAKLVACAGVVAALAAGCERARTSPAPEPTPGPEPRDAGPPPWRPERPATFPSCLEAYAPRPERDARAMCYVRGGAYEVRRPPDPKGPLGDPREWETVEVEDFVIDRDEVTVAQFVRFLNEAWEVERCAYPENLCRDVFPTKELPLVYRDGTWEAVPGKEGLAMWDVEVRHIDAYCAWAGKSIPTLAQWWVAVLNGQDGTRREFPWGDEPTLSRMNCAERWCADGIEGVAPPGTLQDLSDWGVRDGLGNVSELAQSCTHRDPCVDWGCSRDGCRVYGVGASLHEGWPAWPYSPGRDGLLAWSGIRCSKAIPR